MIECEMHLHFLSCHAVEMQLPADACLLPGNQHSISPSTSSPSNTCTRRHPQTHTCVHKCAQCPPRPATSRRDTNDYRLLRLFPLLLLPTIPSRVFLQSSKIVPVLLDSQRKAPQPPCRRHLPTAPLPRFKHILAWKYGYSHTCLRYRVDMSFQLPGGVSIALSGKSTER